MLSSPNLVSEKDKFIIFLHIQKTGGITLQRVFRRKLGQPLFKRLINLAGKKNHQPQTVIEELQAKTVESRYVIGHFCYGIDQYLPKPSTYMAFLREPVSRVISLYDYSKGNSTAYYHQQAISKSLEDFVLNTDLMELDNGQVRFIAGDKQDYFINRTPCGAVDQSLLEQAINNIEKKFSFVGLTEYFDPSMLLLKELMGWSSCLYLRRNITSKQEKTVVSQELKDKIKEKNHLDVALYEYVEKRLKLQLQQAGLDQAEVIQKFKKNNLRFNQFFGPIYDGYDFGKALIKGELGRPS